MKQKKYNWILYILIFAFIAGVVYIATKDITPISRTIEKNIKIEFNK